MTLSSLGLVLTIAGLIFCGIASIFHFIALFGLKDKEKFGWIIHLLILVIVVTSLLRIFIHT